MKSPISDREWIGIVLFLVVGLVGGIAYWLNPRRDRQEEPLKNFLWRPVSLKWYDSSIHTFHMGLLLAAATYAAIWLTSYPEWLRSLKNYVTPDEHPWVGIIAVCLLLVVPVWGLINIASNGAVAILDRYWAGDPTRSLLDEVRDINSIVCGVAKDHAIRSRLLLRILSALEHVGREGSAVRGHVVGVISSDSELCANVPDAPDTLVFIHEQRRWAKSVALAHGVEDWFQEGFLTGSVSALNSAWQVSLQTAFATLIANHADMGIYLPAVSSEARPILPRVVRFIFGGPNHLEGLIVRWLDHLSVWNGKNEHFWTLWPQSFLNPNLYSECLNILVPYSARTASVENWLKGPSNSFKNCALGKSSILQALEREEELYRQIRRDDARRAGADSPDQLFVGYLIHLRVMEPEADERTICFLFRAQLPFFVMLLHHKKIVLFPELLWWLIDPAEVAETLAERLERAKKWMDVG